MNKREKKSLIVQRKRLQLEQKRLVCQRQSDKKEMVKQIPKKILSGSYKEVRESALFEFWQEREYFPESGQDWKREEQRYKEKIRQELQGSCAENGGVILIICRGYRVSQGIDAVRNEAFQVFQYLKRVSIYAVRFLSLESDQTEKLQEGEVTFLPEKDAGAYINAMHPALCIFFESTPEIIRVDHCSMILQKAIFRLSGQNPLQGISQSTIAELNHLNDYGIHKYLVQSKTAYRILVENGFHEPELSYPFLDWSKIYPRKRVFDSEQFTIGFASSPMEERQKKDRGIALLCDMAVHLKQIFFRILWRYDIVEIPEVLKTNENCSVIVGSYSMRDFYSEIDCLLIPYETINSNHACSLSGLEAMYQGIPVLCTKVSGISEIVDFCAMGECVSADWRAMGEAAERIKKNYRFYSSVLSHQLLEKKLDLSCFLDLVEREAKKKLPASVITLYEWDRRLRLHQKYLVKGHQMMKAYYQQEEIAKNYTQDRFTSVSLKYFDLLERQNICAIIEDRFSRFPLRILDLACGDGRITKECVKYGICTAADASRAMLQIVKERFQKEKNPPVLKVFDIAEDSIEGEYDLITCFRYIRHFEYNMRKLFYKKIWDHLAEDGIFIMDVPNFDFELPLKAITGWENYNIYDVFWTKEEITEELKRNGFSVKYLLPVGQGLMKELPEQVRDLPMSWTIGAEKEQTG